MSTRPRITSVVSNLVSFAIRSDKIGSLVIPIVDAGIAVTVNSTDVVNLFTCYAQAHLNLCKLSMILSREVLKSELCVLVTDLSDGCVAEMCGSRTRMGPYISVKFGLGTPSVILN